MWACFSELSFLHMGDSEGEERRAGVHSSLFLQLLLLLFFSISFSHLAAAESRASRKELLCSRLVPAARHPTLSLLVTSFCSLTPARYTSTTHTGEAKKAKTVKRKVRTM